MGNKVTIPPKCPKSGTLVKEEGESIDSNPGDGPPGPSPELLASLQSLRDNSDYTLLPVSLHQKRGEGDTMREAGKRKYISSSEIRRMLMLRLLSSDSLETKKLDLTSFGMAIAEAYSLKEDYHWAIKFLQLEKLYHERLLSNLTALQENWESQGREKKNDESSLPTERDSISEKHMEILSQICRTHLRPSISVEENMLNTVLEDIQSKNETLHSCHDEANEAVTSQQDEEQERSFKSSNSLAALPQKDHQEGDEEEEAEEEEREIYEEGQEVEEEEEEPCEGTPEEEELKVEWPTGVPQASDKDLAKLSHTDGSSSPDGLVSILKRRRASLDGLPPPSNDVTKNSERKVRFSEPEDGIEQDEVGGDSCLILLLLCLVTVVISIGGTALYCSLVGTSSNICTDFTLNVDFYVTNVRGFFEGLGHWLPPRT